MKKLVQRLIIFFIGVPLVLLPIVFPAYNFLLFHIELFVSVAIAVDEMHTIISKKLKTYPKALIIGFSLTLPIVQYLFLLCNISSHYSISVFGLIVIALFTVEFIYSFSGDFSPSIERLASATVLIIYPSFFTVFLSFMSQWTHAQFLIIYFFILIFICDSGAWLFGMVFGRSNKGIVAASPNKSIAGFVGGLIVAVIFALLAFFFLPSHFGLQLFGILSVSILTALAGIIGDLVESLIKRSAEVKDSGSIIIGRGGIMDSIDSIVFAVPVFYTSYQLFSYWNL